MANDELTKELNESITYFEQILDVLPGERTALEFLCVACQQLGDQEKFLKHALALTEVLVREKDAAGAEDLIEKLKDCEDTRAKEAVLKLQVLIGPKPTLEFERPELRPTSSAPSIAAKAELALLEKLVADGVLTRDLAQVAFDQLENLPEEDILVSALVILEKENLPGAADAAAAVADAAHAPPVPLESFELVPGDVRRLPARLVKVRGAVPFAKLGEEWCVAVLNPVDEALREEIEATMGAKCHFFLAPPAQIESVLERLVAEESEEVKGGEGEMVKKSGEGEERASNPSPSAQPRKPKIGVIRQAKK